MRAIVADRYGPPEVLRLAERPRPVPKDDQILIRVHAATVTLGDCELRAFKMVDWVWLPARLAFGITRPRNPVLGMEVAGVVEAVGPAVTRFAPGDRVFGSTGFAMGAYADYVCLGSGAAITTMPEELSFAEAAGIPTGGLNGLHFVRHSRVKAGERVLVNGAGGSIGTFALQIAKSRGAEVTAVDRADKLEMLTALGADHVIDYQRADFWSNGVRYDVIIDVVGKSPFGPSVAALTDTGRYVLGNPRLVPMLRGAWVSRRGGKTVLAKLAGEDLADLDWLKQAVADGSLKVVIDRHFPLEQMREAHRYVEAGNKKGIVVIDVADA